MADNLKIPLGVVERSLAPAPNVGDRVAEIFQSVWFLSIGLPGTTASPALLNDVLKKGGAFAFSSVSGLSGTVIYVKVQTLSNSCHKKRNRSIFFKFTMVYLTVTTGHEAFRITYCAVDPINNFPTFDLL